MDRVPPGFGEENTRRKKGKEKQHFHPGGWGGELIFENYASIEVRVRGGFSSVQLATAAALANSLIWLARAAGTSGASSGGL